MPGQFFIQRNSKVAGPVALDAVKKQIVSGLIRVTDQIGRTADGPWKPIGDVPSLEKMFAPPAVTAPTDDLPDDPYDSEESAYESDEYGSEDNEDDEYDVYDLPEDDDAAPAIPVSAGRVTSFHEAARTFGSAVDNVKVALGNCEDVPKDILELLGAKETVYYAARPSEIVI